MKTITINPEENLNTSHIAEITTIRKKKPLIVPILCGILSIGTLYSAYILQKSENSMFLLLALLGISLLVYTFIAMFNTKEIAFYLEKDNKIKQKSHELEFSQQSKRKQLSEILGGGKSGLNLSNKQGAIKIEILVAKDRNFSACQLSHFVPYEYKPMPEIYCFYDKESNDFIEQLTQLKINE